MSGEDKDSTNTSGGGRSLGGGASEPFPAAWASSIPPARVGRIGAWGATGTPSLSSSGARRFATLHDMNSSAPGGLPPGPRLPHIPHPRHEDEDEEDDDEDDEDERGGESWFAGGQRSGISIQNPDPRPTQGGAGRLVGDILRKAAEAGGPRPVQPTSSNFIFSGSGNVLGSEDIPSAFIPDPRAPPPSTGQDGEGAVAVREITLWREGFSIHGGPLMGYDDPENEAILEAINSGNAPPSVLDVQFGQTVELRVTKRTNESYVAPPKVLRPFAGGGNRLGSPVPGTSSSTTPSSSTPAPATTTADRAATQTHFEVDNTLPITTIQIRLADGTRIVSRMNLTHTVADIRNFINASRPGMSATPYTIGTTFPNRILEDGTKTIKEEKLENSVVVQRML